MPRRNFGPEVKKRAKRFVEALLLFATEQLEGSETLPLKVKWKTDRALSVSSKLRYFEELTKLDRSYGKLSGSEIKECLSRLKDLDLLEDNRFATQGSDTWQFTLHLWQSQWDVEANLRAFDREWEARKGQWRLPASGASGTATATTESSLAKPSSTDPTVQTALSAAPDPASDGPQQDWGDASRAGVFYGRSAELAQLQQWVMADRAQVVTLLGMGGLGKTTLAIQFADQVQEDFRHVIWRSLRYLPSLESLLQDLTRLIGGSGLSWPPTPDGQIAQLLGLLNQHRCLIILDNVESVLQAESSSGYYRSGFEAYGQLFKALAEMPHHSCLLLTSREKPRQVALLEGVSARVQSLALSGLQSAEGLEIFTGRGCHGGSPEEWQEVFAFYGGNPLALQIIASALVEMTDGDVGELMPLMRERKLQFQDVNDLIGRQMERLSAAEQQVMYWLAVHRGPTLLTRLTQDGVSATIPEAVRSLSRRCLIERSGKQLFLQPVVAEYLTAQLVAAAIRELLDRRYDQLRQYALIRATSPDYLRCSQIQHLLWPVVAGLEQALGGRSLVITHLQTSLAQLRDAPGTQPGYVGGSLINLLGLLGVDLSGQDWSDLVIWQAHLTNVNLRGVNMSRASLARCVFKETAGITLAICYSPDGKTVLTTHENGRVRLWNTDGHSLLTCQGHQSWAWTAQFTPDSQRIVSGSADRTLRIWSVATGQCLQVLTGHQGWIWSVSISPDGHTIASASDDGTIKLWEAASGICQRTIPVAGGSVFAVAYSPDGRVFATGSQDGGIGIWEAERGTRLQTLTEHGDSVQAVTFTADGLELASCSQDQTIKIWDWQRSSCLRTLQGHSNTVLTLAYGAGDDVLASGSRDGAIKLWDPATGTCLNTLQGHTARVSTVTFSSEGEYLLSGSHDRSFRVWNPLTGDCMRVFQGHSNGLRSLQFSPDSQSLVAGSDNRNIYLWTWDADRAADQSPDQSSNQSPSKSSDPSPSQSTALSPEPLTTSQRRQAQIIGNRPPGSNLSKHRPSTDRSSPPPIQTAPRHQIIEGHDSLVWAVRFSPDGQTLISGSDDKTVRVWDRFSGLPIGKPLPQTQPIYALSQSPDGQYLAVGGPEFDLQVWQGQIGPGQIGPGQIGRQIGPSQSRRSLSGHTNRIWATDFSADGRYLLSASHDHTVRIWAMAAVFPEPAANACAQVLTGHSAVIMAACFSPDAQLVASGDDSGEIRIWQVATGACLHVLDAHPDVVTALAFTGDGRLISSSLDLRVWDLATGQRLQVIDGHDSGITTIALSPDRRRLASGTADGTIKLWDWSAGLDQPLPCLDTIQVVRPYEGLNITDITGLTEAEQESLRRLGAVGGSS
jgi:WD40 repeat protein